MNVAVIGMQFGDEGKGKIVDYLARDFDITARYCGGSNAGHTVIYEGKKFKLHLVPSGVLQGKIGVLGNGMVIDLEVLKKELQEIREAGIEPRIIISSRAHVVTPLHREMDALEDKVRNIGTTMRGIGPAYETKVKRVGIRMVDLFQEHLLERKLNLMVKFWNIPIDKEEIKAMVKKLHAMGEEFKIYIKDTEIWINQAISSGKSVLFEGAQGAMLDVDFGTYPYVTSSNTNSLGLFSGLGVPAKALHMVIGVAKAYTTRVG
ncbi:MAG TPA: adenylosuccinate synthetase, partial [Candidatus Aciduliprofundum boonei]|nr:adenylosuccinate synthetase [Candidatus Aciduliprofundum boonei]